MVSNTDEVVDDDKEVTEEDLRKIKEESEVETSKEEDESQESETQEESEETEEENSEEESEDESAEESTFVKEFPNIKGDTPEEYAKNLEIAYKNSTSEAMRLKDLSTKEEPEKAEVDISDPAKLYWKQKMDEEINDAFTKFSGQYPQVRDSNSPEYAQFVREVSILSQTILNSQGRLAPPSELYSKTAVILGWKPEVMDDKDNLNAALKNKAAISKTSSVASKPKVQSKVTDADVQIAKQMGGWTVGKTDAEIRKELENI